MGGKLLILRILDVAGVVVVGLLIAGFIMIRNPKNKM
jgi:hypothetical protein